MLKLAGIRLLDDRDAHQVRDVLSTMPLAACMVAARVEEVGLHPARLGGQLWGYGEALTGLCFSGANLVPLCGGAGARKAFADRVLRRRRVCSSLVGPAEQVLPLWEELAAHWGPAREVRAEQPLMIRSTVPEVSGDPEVRMVRPEELDRYLPAAVAMFTEEVGVDPSKEAGAAAYRARIAELIRAGRAFARFENGEVVFKAEIGAMSREVGQVQGVWVHPDRRGNGLGTRGIAAVTDQVVRGCQRAASLYVNDFNTAARYAYEKVGYQRAGTFSTVLLN